MDPPPRGAALENSLLLVCRTSRPTYAGFLTAPDLNLLTGPRTTRLGRPEEYEERGCESLVPHSSLIHQYGSSIHGDSITGRTELSVEPGHASMLKAPAGDFVIPVTILRFSPSQVLNSTKQCRNSQSQEYSINSVGPRPCIRSKTKCKRHDFPQKS
jgi:hypothetical protein